MPTVDIRALSSSCISTVVQILQLKLQIICFVCERWPAVYYICAAILRPTAIDVTDAVHSPYLRDRVAEVVDSNFEVAGMPHGKSYQSLGGTTGDPSGAHT